MVLECIKKIVIRNNRTICKTSNMATLVSYINRKDKLLSPSCNTVLNEFLYLYFNSNLIYW